MAADPAAPDGGPFAPPAAPGGGGAAGEELSACNLPRKRGVDELSDAPGVMAETRSLTESLGLGSGSTPSEEQPLTFVSSKDGESHMFRFPFF